MFYCSIALEMLLLFDSQSGMSRGKDRFVRPKSQEYTTIRAHVRGGFVTVFYADNVCVHVCMYVWPA